MHVTFRFPPLTTLLLLLAPLFAGAESPLPDPVPPAVIGRPLDEIFAARPSHHKSAAARPGQRKQVAAIHPAARTRTPVRVARAPAGTRQGTRVARAPLDLWPAPQVTRAPVARRPRTQVAHAPAVTRPATQVAGAAATMRQAAQLARVPAAAQEATRIAGGPAAVQQAPAAQPVPKQATAPRYAPRTQVASLGHGTRAATRPIGLGRHFNDKDHELVRKYYAAHPASGQAARWKIGEPIPPRAELTGVPDDLRAALSTLPPGHQYVEVDGDVVLVAVQSRVVVDGISRGLR